MGHTVKKCPQANADGEGGGVGLNDDTTVYGNADDDAGAAVADTSSGWGAVPEAATATAGGW